MEVAGAVCGVLSPPQGGPLFLAGRHLRGGRDFRFQMAENGNGGTRTGARVTGDLRRPGFSFYMGSWGCYNDACWSSPLVHALRRRGTRRSR